MGEKYRHFSGEFKRDAVQLVTEKGMPLGKVARELDIHPNLLHLWRRRFLAKGDKAFMGKGRVRPEEGGIKGLRRELEKEKEEREISQDTFYVGYLKGVWRIYLQTAIDTYSPVSFAKVYTAKVPVTAADLLNDRGLPFFEEQQIPVLRVLTDRGTEFCGAPEKHPYELYLELNDIEHTKTKAKSPQTNGICERVHQTILNEFYRVAFRKKINPDLANRFE